VAANQPRVRANKDRVKVGMQAGGTLATEEAELLRGLSQRRFNETDGVGPEDPARSQCHRFVFAKIPSAFGGTRERAEGLAKCGGLSVCHLKCPQHGMYYQPTGKNAQSFNLAELPVRDFERHYLYFGPFAHAHTHSTFTSVLCRFASERGCPVSAGSSIYNLDATGSLESCSAASRSFIYEYCAVPLA
jgi:hypothetical protein